MLTIDLSGRRALVTGGDGGLGAAACRALAACRAWVGIGWRGDRAPADKLAAELHASEGRAVPIPLQDVADPASTSWSITPASMASASSVPIAIRLHGAA